MLGIVDKAVLAQDGSDLIENRADRRIHADVLLVDQREAALHARSKCHAVKHVVPVEVYYQKYRSCHEDVIADQNDETEAKRRCEGETCVCVQ